MLVDFQADWAANLQHNAECLETVMDMGQQMVRAEHRLMEALAANDSNIIVSKECSGPGATAVVAGARSAASSSLAALVPVASSTANAALSGVGMTGNWFEGRVDLLLDIMPVSHLSVGRLGFC